MNQADYERLLARLDSYISAAERTEKIEEERAAIGEALTKIREQMAGVSSRIETLRNKGVIVPAEAEDAFWQLVNEESILLDKIKKLSPAQKPVSKPSPKPISASIKAALEGRKISKELSLDKKSLFLDLGEEIEKTNLWEFEHSMRWAIIELWACRWRVALESVGQEYGDDKDVRRVYALIKENMEQYYTKKETCRYIAALNPRKTEDWSRHLKIVQAEVDRYRAEFEAKRAIRKKLSDLEELLKRDDLPYEEAERQLKHLVRDVARNENLRGELVDIVEPYRKSLGAEFDYLFENGKPERNSQEKIKLSNRDIVSRLLRRMLRKNIIGSRYAPVDMIPKGFPPHDYGKAKDAIRILIQTGVLSTNKGGEGITIDTKWVSQIEKFLNGEHLGVTEVDSWMVE